jgi:hypothetical protein
MIYKYSKQDTVAGERGKGLLTMVHTGWCVGQRPRHKTGPPSGLILGAGRGVGTHGTSAPGKNNVQSTNTT